MEQAKVNGNFFNGIDLDLKLFYVVGAASSSFLHLMHYCLLLAPELVVGFVAVLSGRLCPV